MKSCRVELSRVDVLLNVYQFKEKLISSHRRHLVSSDQIDFLFINKRFQTFLFLSYLKIIKVIDTSEKTYEFHSYKRED